MDRDLRTSGARTIYATVVLALAFLGRPQAVLAQEVREPRSTAAPTGSASTFSRATAELPGAQNQQILEELERMRARIEQLEAQLKAQRSNLASGGPKQDDSKQSPAAVRETPLIAAPAAQSSSNAAVAAAQSIFAPLKGTLAPPSDTQTSIAPAESALADLLHGTTLNFLLDGYYSYNFNAPIGRVNLTRAYDVSSNSFSLNQADLVLENAPDPEHGKRYGARIDFQYGQATQTLQGNPANEQRPDIYRALFQAYGTYIVPVGGGLKLDFGKWASALGIENNYTMEQNDYSRSFWFNFLPFYHMGLRASYPVNRWLAANYWLVNGEQQTEDFNGFKDQLFGVVLQPKPSVSWTVNYYFGQEHPDFAFVSGGAGLPVIQGEPFAPIPNAPTGKLHIIDSYVSWNASSKLTLALEGDYVIERLFTQSAPFHTDGGAAYARYQLTPKFALASRAEYMSDRGGLFSGTTQALKEVTLTGQYQFAPGFMMFEEWRHDFSNQPYFLTDTLGSLKNEQTTATAGLVWWFGPKPATSW
jgi:Putative beta-barrel porin-2, OmpL-like. bbp2